MRLTTLVTRRKRGDLIQLYKILNGLDRVEWNNELSKADWGGKSKEGVVLAIEENLQQYVQRETIFF